MRKRLDHLLVEKDLAPTRSRARDAIQRGLVTVAGERVEKPGQMTDVTSEITVAAESGLDYVSRGALKLVAALDQFGFSPAARVAVDIGASTGGFTDVLLRRGAKKVFAVDIGCEQLDARLKSNPKVEVLEKTDVRNLTGAQIDQPFSAVVADVSFISLLKVLPPVLKLTGPGAWLVGLIKPQFEVGRAAIGKRGIVRDVAAQQNAVRSVCDWIDQQPGWSHTKPIVSPIKGGSGNTEFLIGACRDE